MISSRMDGFSFHPVIRDWFLRRFRNPTDPQAQGWPHIAAGKHTLIAAPTGSGKTLTAFLAVIDRLFREAAEGSPADEIEGDEAEEGSAAEPKAGIRVIYVSPLRALSNDMQKNLEQPLQEIYAEAAAQGLNVPPIRVGLRTGDTPSHKRAAIVKNPPQILVTTPESLYLMLTSERAREVLRSVDTLIVDEIHALVRDKRGSHLSLSVERLAALTNKPLQRIGLSATQKPIERMAEFLIGAQSAETPPTEPLPCAIVDVGHQRQLDLEIEVPPSELSAVCSHEQWAEVNARIVELINTHRSTLIFVNTRRMAERVTYQLTQLLGEEAVASHHGSLAAEIRLSTEQKLKSGELKAVVATASLELGIDVGYIDLVIQLGSPRSIATFLQRIGRSGHALGLVPKGRLFALTRDEVLECMALIRAIRAGRLDVIPIPESPTDVLAQQIVAEVAAREWSTDELFTLIRRAYPYRDLPRDRFDKILTFLSEGLTTGAGRGTTLLHHDQVNRRLRSRAGSRINATTNGGAIPEVDQIRVVLDQEQTVVGSVDEEFGIESQAGDIFLLGNTSWRILALRGNDLIVGDAQGAPPTIPFWRGEAPGRTIELSEEISALREHLEARIREALLAAGLPNSDDENAAPWAPPAALVRWLVDETHCTPHAAGQMVEYVAAQQAAVGLVPTQTRVIFERFFDESGGMQLVVHAPFGSRINRAWGLAMRKRFCRSFDFELQATADDDGFILSLGPQHSFPIESLFPMMRTDNARNLLEQAILAVPMFQLRWRWNATRALQVSRMRNGKKVPPALQRFRSDDLLTAVFPKLTGCQENIVGDHEIPDHPLVQQTMEDCLHEALDLDGLLDVLAKVESGAITFVARDTREPSPFAYELLNSNPYAFLDGGEVQERRARTAQTRRSVSVESARDLGRLDPAAIAQVIEEARPIIRNADDLHDVLQSRIFVPLPELVSTLRSPPQLLAPIEWVPLANRLIEDGRAAKVTLPSGLQGWTCAERWPALRAIFPEALTEPELTAPASVRHDWTDVEARLTLIRGAIEIAGPVTAHELASVMGLTENEAFACLEALEGEGIVLRGRFRNGSAYDPAGDPRATDVEWCHRRLLSRIHRKTVAGLRREIEPVDVPTFMRFLFQHQCLLPGVRRKESTGAFDAIVQLQGMDIPAVAWERDILPSRVENYRREWLDELCLTGEVGWTRLHPPGRDPEKARPMASLTRVAPISLFLREDLGWLMTGAELCPRDSLSTPAQELVEHLERGGAMFATDLLSATRMLPAQLDDALGELVARGVVTSDGFSGLRALVREGSSESGAAKTGPKVVRHRRASSTGRWTLVPTRLATEIPEPTSDQRRTFVEEWAWQLLRRWGVVFKDLLTREQGTPAWWELVQHFRRLEARGEIRGGRFIQGVAGEQFALSDTVRTLRDLRDAPLKGDAVSPAVAISAADPLNLVGILTDHARVPSTAGNRILYWHGRPVAHLIGGECTISPDCPPEAIPIVRQRFELRVAAPTPSPVPLRDDVALPGPAPAAAETAEKPTAPEDQKKRPPARVLLRPASNQRMFPSGAPRPRFS